MSVKPGAQAPDETQLQIAQLLARVAANDVHALSELYDRFSTVLRAIAMRVLSDLGDADDTLQEVFMRIWDHAARYSMAEGTPATWLITLTRNASLNRLRSRNRQRAAVDRAAREPVVSSEDAASTYDKVVSAETALLVRDALANLPDEQRIPLELAYLKGLTYEEVAQKLRQPIGSVKSRLRRGMIRMKQCLTTSDLNNHE